MVLNLNILRISLQLHVGFSMKKWQMRDMWGGVGEAGVGEGEWGRGGGREKQRVSNRVGFKAVLRRVIES